MQTRSRARQLETTSKQNSSSIPVAPTPPQAASKKKGVKPLPLSTLSITPTSKIPATPSPATPNTRRRAAAIAATNQLTKNSQINDSTDDEYVIKSPRVKPKAKVVVKKAAAKKPAAKKPAAAKRPAAKKPAPTPRNATPPPPPPPPPPPTTTSPRPMTRSRAKELEIEKDKKEPLITETVVSTPQIQDSIPNNNHEIVTNINNNLEKLLPTRRNNRSALLHSSFTVPTLTINHQNNSTPTTKKNKQIASKPIIEEEKKNMMVDELIVKPTRSRRQSIQTTKEDDGEDEKQIKSPGGSNKRKAKSEKIEDESESEESSESEVASEHEEDDINFANLDYVRCTHLKHLHMDQVKNKLFDANSWKCKDCSSTHDILICLTCGVVACCSFKRHAQHHFRHTGHPLVLEIHQQYKNCYCFQCGNFVRNDNAAGELDLLRQILYNTAFESLKSRLVTNDNEGKICQDDIEETAFNHYQMSLTRKFFFVWKDIMSDSKSRSSGGLMLPPQSSPSKGDANTSNPPIPSLPIISSPPSSANGNGSHPHHHSKKVRATRKIEEEAPLLPSIMEEGDEQSTTRDSMVIDNDQSSVMDTSIDEHYQTQKIKKSPSQPPLPSPPSSKPKPTNIWDSPSNVELSPSSTSSSTTTTPSGAAGDLMKAPTNKSYSSTYLMSKLASSPIKKNGIIPGVTGLRNLGNTCFMNTILQSLSNIPEFRSFFVQLRSVVGPSTFVSTDPLSITNRQSTMDCLNLIKKHKISPSNLSDFSFSIQLHYLFRVLWSGKWSVVTPSSLLESVWKFIPKFKNYQQQDAQEFFSYLLDCISLELNPKNNNNNGNNANGTKKPEAFIYKPLSTRKRRASRGAKNETDIKDIINQEFNNNNNLDNNNFDNNIGSINNIIESNNNIELNNHINQDKDKEKDKDNLQSLIDPIIVKEVDNNNNNTEEEEEKKEDKKDNSQSQTTTTTTTTTTTVEDDIISKIFQGKLRSEITCLKCNSKVSRLEPFLELTLDVPVIPATNRRRKPKKTESNAQPTENGGGANNNICSLEDCIKSLIKNELLDGKIYRCDHCKDLQEAQKRFSIDSLPNVLCVVLKRFRWRANHCSKIETEVTFPFELDLSTFVEEEKEKEKVEKEKEKEKDKENEKEKDKMGDEMKDDVDNDQKINNSFELLNVINHHGSSLFSGHYTAYCFNDLQEIWVHYNDSKATIVEAEEVIDASKTTAYILFYQRKGSCTN